MLFLILANGNMRRPIGKNVSRHQGRIGEQPDRRILAVLAGLFLELCHSVQPAKPGHAVKYPGKLRMLRHARLVEQDRAPRRNAGGNQACCHLARTLAKLLWILRHGNGMQIDNTIDRFKAVLKRHPVADGPKIIAKVKVAGRLDSGKNPVFRHGLNTRHDRMAFPGAALLKDQPAL